MKKASIVLAVCFAVALVMGSCSGSKKCPAYSQNKTNQTEASRA